MSQSLVSQEMGKRVFWALWSTLQSLQLSDAGYADVSLRPESDSYRYPPLPMEPDDDRVRSAFVEEHLTNEADLITAFNARVHIQQSLDLDPRNGLSRITLIQGLEQCKALSHELPSHLVMRKTGVKNGVSKTETERETPRDPALMVPSADEKDPVHQTLLQHRMQSRDLFRTQLSIRTHIILLYSSLVEDPNSALSTAQSKDPADLARVAAAGLNGMMQGQRQDQNQTNGSLPNYREDANGVVDDEQHVLVRDLLWALADVSYVNIEPFGDHFVSTLRNLSYMLLSPHFLQKGPLLEEALPHLQAFLQAIHQLEQVVGSSMESENASMQMAADLNPELEHRCWEQIDRAKVSFKTLSKRGI
ncbi:MAG: hypothetical protein M1822_005397 [Bathelium mastoideum]|nr:MAG: hypothetical protein M1822_005397 [Bathelium mastoideum]